MKISEKKTPALAAPTEDSWLELSDPPGSRPVSDSIVIPRVKGLRVLLLGTHVPRLEGLAAELRSRGVHALAAKADDHGYREALSFGPDVAISEMARPGDPGWWLLRRFHRHPLLRWTPALLMKWWEEKNAREVILIDRVFERLSEALTPIRVLEERIAAGRKLADRVDLTGIQTVLRVFVSAGLTGRLSVNDSWNVFDLDFEAGEIRSISRRGVGGDGHEGEVAFMQLLLCDSGHWNFRTHDSGPRPHNLFLSLSEQCARAGAQISRFIGPDALLPNHTSPAMRVSSSLCHDLAGTFSGMARDVIEAIATGATPARLAELLGDEKDRTTLERAVITLLRSGAIVPQPDQGGGVVADSPGKDGTRGAEYLFRWISEDHRAAVVVAEHSSSAHLPGTSREKKTGYYNFSNLDTDKVVGNVGRIKAPGQPPEQTRELTPPSVPVPVTPDEADTLPPGSPVGENDSGWRRQFTNESSSSLVGGLFSGARPHDSLAPGPTVEDRSRQQMWLALALAIILGALLVAGLVVIGGDSEELDSMDPETDPPAAGDPGP